MKHSTPLILTTAAASLLLLAGCVPNAPADAAATVIAVESTADACNVETDTAASGTVTFSVTNAGDRVTEFYLLRDDELSIVAEVENIAPGASRDLTVVAQPGTYSTVCKPGMIGEGLGKATFTVTGDVVDVSDDEAKAFDAAVESYLAYVKTQAAELVTNTQE